jgi:hypothetical protein
MKILFILEKGVDCRVARFFLAQHAKHGKKYTKRPQNIQNDHRILKCLFNLPNGRNKYQNFPFQSPPKYIKIWIFGLKK